MCILERIINIYYPKIDYVKSFTYIIDYGVGFSLKFEVCLYGSCWYMVVTFIKRTSRYCFSIF